MALIITPSEDPDITLDVKYATPGDILTVLQVNQLVVGFPSAQPNPAIYSCRSLVNTKGVTDLSNAWANCTAITEFPLLDFQSCVNFESAWEGCTSLTTFPANAFDNCQATNFNTAWTNCALSQQSVDNILISINTAGKLNGTLNIDQGTSSSPSLAGWNAVDFLIAKGWTVTVNGTRPFVNLIPYPSEFQSWQVWTGQLIPDQIAAPDGTITADKWIGGSADSYGQRVAFYDLYPPNVPQIPANSTCRASIDVKRFGDQARNIQIDLWWAGTVNFNLNNPQGSIAIFNSSYFTLQSLNVDTLPNGWYRCYFTFTYISQPAWYFRYHLRMLDNNLVSNYSGVDTSGLYLCNARFYKGTTS